MTTNNANAIATLSTMLDNAVRLGHGAHTVALAAALRPSLSSLDVRSECVWCADKRGTRGLGARRLPRGGECHSCAEVGADVIVTWIDSPSPP